jgi:protein-S-isoprenylcysteine O-methyltransferase Ste14
MDKKKGIIASYAGVLFFACFVFVGAWTFRYWQGWLYLVLAIVGTTISHALVPADSTLTTDRAREAREGQDWDKKLLRLIFLVSLVTFVTAGLDSGRFGWSGRVPGAVTVAGVVLMLAGQVIFAVAKRQNRFFSSTVRIQSDRGHAVCSTGLYTVVRHPGYVGMLLSMLAVPLVLNAYVAFMPTAVGVALLVARTAREDRFLVASLPGYADFTGRTRWRLVPGLY